MVRRLPLYAALMLLPAACGEDEAADGADGRPCRLSDPQCDDGLVCRFGTCEPGQAGEQDPGRTAQNTQVSIQLSKTTMQADGVDRVAVILTARDRSTFEPVAGEVVLSADPPAGAVVIPGRTALTSGGADFELIACDPDINTCPSTFVVHASFSNRPLEVVATSPAITVEGLAPAPDPEESEFLPTDVPADSLCRQTTEALPLTMSLTGDPATGFDTGFAISAAEAVAINEGQTSLDLLLGGTTPNGGAFSATLRLVSADGVIGEVSAFRLFDRDVNPEPPAGVPGFGSLELELAGAEGVPCLTARDYDGQAFVYTFLSEPSPTSRVRRAVVEFDGTCLGQDGVEYAVAGCLNYDISRDPRFATP